MKATTELLDGGPVGHTHPNAFSDGPWEYLRYEEKTSVMVTGGYRHLVDVLADPLDQERIFLEHAVTAIRCGTPPTAPPPSRSRPAAEPPSRAPTRSSPCPSGS